MLVGVIAVVQLVELVGGPTRAPRRCRSRGARSPRPYATFAGAVIGFQLLLPSMLFPDTGDGPRYIPDRLGDYAGVLTEQLGLGRHPFIGIAVLVLAVAGMVVGCVRRPRLDVPLAALTVLSTSPSAPTSGWSAATTSRSLPWVLYFAAAAVVAAVGRRCCLAGTDVSHRGSPRSRWRSSSSSTSPCCQATSPTPASSTAPAAVQVGPADPG